MSLAWDGPRLGLAPISDSAIDLEEDESDDDTINESSLGWSERDSQRIWSNAGGDYSDLQGWE